MNQLTNTKLDAFRRCIIRELNFRENFYPKWVENKKMTQKQADFEISTMKEIKEYFDYLQMHTIPEQTKLF